MAPSFGSPFSSKAFIRLRQNTLQLAQRRRLRRVCCMDDLPSIKLWHDKDGGANRVEALQGEDGLASAQFRFYTPQLAAGSFIDSLP